SDRDLRVRRQGGLHRGEPSRRAHRDPGRGRGDRQRAQGRRAGRGRRPGPAPPGGQGGDQARAGGQRVVGGDPAAEIEAMSRGVSEPFTRRPVATTLLMVGLLLVGIAAFTQLPVSALPQVDYPTIVVSTYLPGGSADTMASAEAI